MAPLHIDAAGLVFVNERLHLLRPGWWEQQGIESRVSLLLIDEFGQVLLGHVGFGFSMVRSEDLIDFWPRTEAHEEALVHRFWEVLRIDSIVLAFCKVTGTEGSFYTFAIGRKHLEKTEGAEKGTRQRRSQA